MKATLTTSFGVFQACFYVEGIEDYPRDIICELYELHDDETNQATIVIGDDGECVVENGNFIQISTGRYRYDPRNIFHKIYDFIFVPSKHLGAFVDALSRNSFSEDEQRELEECYWAVAFDKAIKT